MNGVEVLVKRLYPDVPCPRTGNLEMLGQILRRALMSRSNQVSDSSFPLGSLSLCLLDLPLSYIPALDSLLSTEYPWSTPQARLMPGFVVSCKLS